MNAAKVSFEVDLSLKLLMTGILGIKAHKGRISSAVN